MPRVKVVFLYELRKQQAVFPLSRTTPPKATKTGGLGVPQVSPATVNAFSLVILFLTCCFPMCSCDFMNFSRNTVCKSCNRAPPLGSAMEDDLYTRKPY
ncbi:hypothetical protein SASPL_128483 [Salvia splendens]|uniref:Uncharacterized protein n=1 Tax=Salvia splendens TaxID=180675 RepID=A0A8X8XBL4_SALSN|nr:hypothetical protein SASPL_128483 [Salvia splendens]